MYARQNKMPLSRGKGRGDFGPICVKTTKRNDVNACFSERITFTNAPSPQEFTEGDNADIICDVESSPPPTVLWKYKGRKIQMEKDGKIFISLLVSSLKGTPAAMSLKKTS